jgi:hypothetical protein
MKKILFVLGVVAAFSFAACDSTKDCACDIIDAEDGLTIQNAATVNPAGDLDVLEYDGDCSDIKTWSEFSGKYQPTETLKASTILNCKEK